MDCRLSSNRQVGCHLFYHQIHRVRQHQHLRPNVDQHQVQVHFIHLLLRLSQILLVLLLHLQPHYQERHFLLLPHHPIYHREVISWERSPPRERPHSGRFGLKQAFLPQMYCPKMLHHVRPYHLACLALQIRFHRIEGLRSHHCGRAD